eukprot:8591335-Pyramimonas_sp.AAC.1
MGSIQAMQASLTALSSTMGEHCASIDKAVEKRMVKVETEVRVHDTRIGKLEKEVEELRNLLGLMRREEPPPKIEGGGFDRPVDHTIIVVRTQVPLPKQTVGHALQAWIDDSNLQADEYELQGDAVAKRFQIQIRGQAGYAARKVNMAIGALKMPGRGGGWREFSAVPPTGGPAARINVGPDKNPKMVARELGCKK